MINHAKFPTLDIRSAQALMDEYYPIEMDEDTFIEKAYSAWRHIGNKFSYIHVYEEKIPDDGIITIPDNIESIKIVTSPDYFYSLYMNEYDSIFFYRNGSLLRNLKDIEKPVFQDDRLNKLGKIINYELHDTNVLHFDKILAGFEVYIVYNGLIVNEINDSCIPLINKKEAEAIAHRVAFIEARNLVWLGDQTKIAVMKLAEEESSIAMVDATIPEEINENLMDEALNIKVSMDRKTFGKNFKVRK